LGNVLYLTLNTARLKELSTPYTLEGVSSYPGGNNPPTLEGISLCPGGYDIPKITPKTSIDFSSRRDKEKDMEGEASGFAEASPSRSVATPLRSPLPSGDEGLREETANSPEPQSAHWKEKLDIISQSLMNGDAVEKGVVQLLAQRMLSDVTGKKFAASVAFKRAIAKSDVSDIVAAMVSLSGDVDAGRLEGMKDPVGVFVAMLCPKRKGKKAKESTAKSADVQSETQLPKIDGKQYLAEELDPLLDRFDPNAHKLQVGDEIFWVSVARRRDDFTPEFQVDRRFFLKTGLNQWVEEAIFCSSKVKDDGTKPFDYPIVGTEFKYLAIRKP
jgi:hypothetical protein